MDSQKNKYDEIDNMLFEYFNENKEIPKDTENLLKNIKYKKKRNYSMIRKVAIILISLSILTTGLVFANDIVDFFRNLFSLNSINIDNDSVVDSIENRNYIQNVNSDYVEINSDYKIKVDYLMLDDINLYLVFNLYANNNIDQEYRFSITDLTIKNDKNEVLYSDVGQSDINGLTIVKGSNKVSIDNSHEKKELIFLMSNGFPQTKTLNISFSKIVLYKENHSDTSTITLDCNFDLSIDIIDKFINRDIYEFANFETIDNCIIKKCLSNDTGTYIILESSDPSISYDLNINNNIYTPTRNLLGITNNNTFEILLQFNITKNNFSLNDVLTLQNTSGTKIHITK